MELGLVLITGGIILCMGSRSHVLLRPRALRLMRASARAAAIRLRQRYRALRRLHTSGNTTTEAPGKTCPTARPPALFTVVRRRLR